MDILKPNILIDEPYDIYYKCHGALAERIIGSSKVFLSADKSLIKELAYNSKFLILPRASTLTLFGVPSKNVTWIANGEVKYEYHNDKGELVERFEGQGQMLTMGSVFFGKAALRTIYTATYCEVLYIPLKDFLKIYKRYPLEWSIIEKSRKEFSKKIDVLFYNYIKKHKEYQKKLRKRIFHARQSVATIKEETAPSSTDEKQQTYIADLASFSFIENPETKFLKFWMLFRMITTIVLLMASVLGGGPAAHIVFYIGEIQAFCRGAIIIDIILKLFLPYYNDKGILITDTTKCAMHYLSRTFVMDMLGILPLNAVAISLLSDRYIGNVEFLLDNIPQFVYLYIIAGYFNYFADAPSMKSIYILILKWQLLLTLMFIAVSAFFVTRCIHFEWDKFDRLVNMTKADICWLPVSFKLPQHPSFEELQIVFAQALSMGQNALHTVDLGMFNINRTDYATITFFLSLGVFYWYVFVYNQTLLMLQSRSDNIFQHGVNQLTDFMKSERVEQEIVDKVLEHYNYVWLRTKGLNIQDLMTERIGMIFKEDLNYYFYKKTFAALDTMIKGGEAMQRRLANIMQQSHFMPGEDIMREMDLVSKIFVVHRGCVLVTQNNKKLAVLYKGGIFGQFESGTPRPIKVTIQALEHTDVLTMTVKDYQDILTDSEKRAVLSYPETTNDYMTLKKALIENPYNKQRKLVTHRSWAIILKFIIGLLILHAIACGWMFIACKDIADNPYGEPFDINDVNVNATINYNEWSSPSVRGKGCCRLTRKTMIGDDEYVWFIVGKTWPVDYFMALTFVIILYMSLNLDLLLGLSLVQIYYKVMVVIILYIGEMWISSVAISAIYTKYREMYLYAYDVSNLIQYLKQNSLSKQMLGAVKWYTKMLWSRQKGNWIPEMALQAPTCLREDIFSALYLHHLMTPVLFQNHLPPYFMRQLVVRFKRMVIFPGKFIIKEGDIYSSIYFIHEGEVEKWYTDINGNNKISAVLTMNGYFGLIPGLFPNTPFMFTYYSRTVCDLLLLKHEEWQDILNGYPEIKNNLYKAATDLLHKERKKQ